MTASAHHVERLDGALYPGIVSHKRLRPKPHALAYGVFSMLVDLDRLGDLDRRLRLFSTNRWNLYSFHDRDHGPGDGALVAGHYRAALTRAGFDVTGGRLLMLCYPRVLGFVFNPISVVYAYDRDGRHVAMVYEVNNTFGERKSYVIAVEEPAAQVHAQGCAKEMSVSPFTASSGEYGFRVTAPGDDLVVAVTLRDAAGPILKTMFKGRRAPMTDRRLAWFALAYPLLTLKVVAAINLEAAKLWWKGIPVVRRHRSPRYSVSVAGREAGEGGAAEGSASGH